jgi:glycosyltransferase involved in cell wall biosynthesis
MIVDRVYWGWILMARRAIRESQPLVSVIMSVYNGEDHISESIASVLSQRYGNFELIVIDDGSTDRTVQIVGSFLDPRVRLMAHAENRKLAICLNEGVSAARGRYVARLDADDVCHPLRLVRQVRYMERHPEVAVLGGSALVGGDGRGLLRYPIRHGAIKTRLLFENAMCHPTIMFRKESIPQWYEPTVLAGQDYELWVRLVWVVGFANLRSPLITYRMHGGQTAKTLAAEQLAAANGARKSMVSSLLECTVEEWELYLDGCGRKHGMSRERLLDLERLLSSMAVRNRRLGIFDERLLSRYSYDLMGNQVCESLRAGLLRPRNVVGDLLIRYLVLRPRCWVHLWRWWRGRKMRARMG